MDANILPNQPPFGIGDVRAQDFRPSVDTIWQVHGHEQVGCVAVEHTMECDTSGMPFLSRHR
ncbi:hypothetical protein LOM8899_02209 [Flavimaricola marinus]|uniref:Uncharacterized protein n=1 Tax=Flavimaricola marinus TaxID=1819565 RepID=A0A238LEK3_9RHOB|nr:hypothetical protein LOM8899_02209 [Flavimaricola marinus]